MSRMILSLRKYRPRPPPRHGICDISHDKSRRLCKPTLHVPLSVYGDHSVQLMRWPLQGVVVVACPHRRRHTHARTHTHAHTRRHADTRADEMGSESPSCCGRQWNTARTAAISVQTLPATQSRPPRPHRWQNVAASIG